MELLDEKPEPTYEVPLQGTSLHHNVVNRQNYAIQDISNKMKEAIKFLPVKDVDEPSVLLKEDLQTAFFFKEMMFSNHDELLNRIENQEQSAVEAENYIKDATVNGPFYETMNEIEKAKMSMMEKRAPMPPELKKNFAKVNALADKIARDKKLKKSLDNQKSAVTSNKGSKAQEAAEIEFTKEELRELEKEKQHRLMKLKDPRYYNDPKILSKLGVGNVFQREMRKDIVRMGYKSLLKNLDESNLTLRQIKNGQTLFDKEVMKLNYDNPYFANNKMREQMEKYLESCQPKTKGNTKIQEADETLFPNYTVQKNIERGGPCQARDTFMKKQRNEKVRSQVNKTQTVNQDDQSIFNQLPQTAHSVPPGKRYAEKNQTQTNGFAKTANGYAAGSGGSQRGGHPTDLNLTLTECGDASNFSNTIGSNMNKTQGRNAMRNKFNTTSNFNPKGSQDSIGGPQSTAAFNQTTVSKRSSTKGPNTIQAQTTLTSKLAGSIKEAMKESLLRRLRSKNDKPMNQNPFLKPYAMIDRNENQEANNELNLPCSPAFVNSYVVHRKKGGYAQVTKTTDFCHKKNIPFCSEEDKMFRVKQFNKKMQVFREKMNDHYETDLPKQFDVGMRMMINHPRQLKEDKVTKHFMDKQLYFPQVAQKLVKQMGGRSKSLACGPQVNSQNSNITVDSTNEEKPLDQQMFEKLDKEDGITLKKLNVPQENAKELQYVLQAKRRSMLVDLEKQLNAPISLKEKGLSPVKGNTKKRITISKEQNSESAIAKFNENQAAEQARDNQLFKFFSKCSKAKFRQKKRGDPIRQILKANERVVNFNKQMNKKLQKIIERCIELDRPILMHDKLDIIWDKEPSMKQSVKKEERPNSVFSPEKGSSLTSKDPLQKDYIKRLGVVKSNQNTPEKKNKKKLTTMQVFIRECCGPRPERIESPKKEHDDHDNVNQFAVKKNLKLRKIERQMINQKQAEAYEKFIEYIDSRKAKFKLTEMTYIPSITVDERERAFLDALTPIIQSGYFLSPHDFYDMLTILSEIDNLDEPPTVKTQVLNQHDPPRPRNDTEKRKAQVLDFFLLVCRELSFFTEASDEEVMIFLEETLYPEILNCTDAHQISSIQMNEQDINQQFIDDEIEDAFGQTMSNTQRTGGWVSKGSKAGAAPVQAQANRWIDAHETIMP